jgi:hypothetical protein
MTDDEIKNILFKFEISSLGLSDCDSSNSECETSTSYDSSYSSDYENNTEKFVKYKTKILEKTRIIGKEVRYINKKPRKSKILNTK